MLSDFAARMGKSAEIGEKARFLPLSRFRRKSGPKAAPYKATFWELGAHPRALRRPCAGTVLMAGFSSRPNVHNKRRNRLSIARATELVRVHSSLVLLEENAAKEDEFHPWHTESDDEEEEAGQEAEQEIVAVAE